MVVRGNPQLGAPGMPMPLPTDPRRDMLKELIAARLVAELASAEGTLKDIVQTGERGVERTQRLQREAPLRPQREGRDPVQTTTATGAAPEGRPPDTRPVPTSEQVQRALQNIQRDAGLPITGRFDDATAALLLKLGVVTQKAAPAPAPKPAEPAPTPKKPVDAAQQQQTRQAVTQREQLLRARVETAPRLAIPTTPKASTTSARAASEPPPPPMALDRALDPARLLASLVAAGFKAPTPTQALSAFQTAAQLPPTGQLDKQTLDALVKQGVVSSEAAKAHEQKSASETSSSTAASAAKKAEGGASKASAQDSSQQQGSGAKQQAQVTRAPASSPEEARELARLESLLAQAAATERGVQEATGDPAALAGHGQTPGATTGVSGAGAQGGGADTGGDEASVAVGDEPGEESSVGNADAGDDDHDDERRGEASDALADEGAPNDDDAIIPDGHYRVVALSEQVTLALETIARIDDDHGPVTYTWDVTLYRPGVYADGQPAEAVWHLVVDRAHAFDAVWRKATDAIAARLLYVEPDAVPPSLDDVLAALRRARVRDPASIDAPSV